MQKKILLKDTEVTYTLYQNPRAKRLRITVHADQRVVVTIPEYYFRRSWNIERAAEKFLVEKTDWLLESLKSFEDHKPINTGKNSRKNYLKHKESSRKLVLERLEHFNKTYNFQFNRVSIKDQKTCWGSCSSKKNLNFNYKILFLPQELADYIIVHELCHTEELNHSPKFWDLVAQTIPNHKTLRKQLNQTLPL